MINFRYHVVSLTAVLLALAAGIVLGAGYLDGNGFGSDDSTDGGSTDSALTSFEAGYTSRTGPQLVDGALTRRSVLVMTTPGARPNDIKGIRSAVEDAGGSVIGQVELTAKLLDPGGRQFADGVAEQAGSGIAEVTSASGGYDRIGTALGRAYLGKDDADLDNDATQLGSAFTEGGLVSVSGDLKSRANVAIIVTGPRSQNSESQGQTLAALATAMDKVAGGVVVAGPSSSSLEGGLVAAVRDDDGATGVSTVDVTELPAGRIVTVLAAAKDLAGEAGAWGTSRSADGAVPR